MAAALHSQQDVSEHRFSVDIFQFVRSVHLWLPERI